MIYEQPSTEQQVSQWGLKDHLKHLLLNRPGSFVCTFFILFYGEIHKTSNMCYQSGSSERCMPCKIIHSEQT